jgi:hypothetical protein
MMSKFTKGTWVAVGAWVEHVSDSKADICNCDPASMGQEHLKRSDAEQRANARLIAAAPTMHALLTMAVARIELEDAPPMLAAWAEDARQLLERIK